VAAGRECKRPLPDEGGGHSEEEEVDLDEAAPYELAEAWGALAFFCFSPCFRVWIG
jgi:hypothetical protein